MPLPRVRNSTLLTHLIYLTFPQWHLGQREQYLPTSHGFDSYLGIPFSQDMVRTQG